MTTSLVWTSIAWPGLEHVVWSGRDNVRASGEAVHVLPEGPTRLTYEIDTPNGRTRRVAVTTATSAGERTVDLAAEDGVWRDATGEQLPHLDGCVDVDISVTPLTNTLPIRRLGLEPGQYSDLLVTYIDVPTLTVTASRQRYTALWKRDDTAGYRYESGSFRADLVVDSNSFVIDYPDLWKRRPTG